MPTSEDEYMPSIEEYETMARQAIEMAATEVVTWAPLKIDDHVCGKVVDTGTIELPSLRIPGEMEVWPTNTLEPIGEVVLDGEILKDLNDKVLRVAWLGPVQLRHYQRTLPANRDVVAMHYQSDQTPKSGLNDYKLVNCIVFDHTTGKVKVPRALANGVADLGTGEVITPKVLNVGPSALDPVPGETPFGDEDVTGVEGTPTSRRKS